MNRATRRSLLAGVGGLGTTSLSGCIGFLGGNSSTTLVSEEGTALNGHTEVELSKDDTVSVDTELVDAGSVNQRDRLSYDLNFQSNLQPRPPTNVTTYGPVVHLTHLPSGKPIAHYPSTVGTSYAEDAPRVGRYDSVTVPESGAYLLSWSLPDHPYRKLEVGFQVTKQKSTENPSGGLSVGNLGDSPTENYIAATERLRGSLPTDFVEGTDSDDWEHLPLNVLPKLDGLQWHKAAVFGPAHLSLMENEVGLDAVSLDRKEEFRGTVEKTYDRLGYVVSTTYLYWEIREQINRIVELLAEAVVRKLGVSNVKEAKQYLTDLLTNQAKRKIPLQLRFPEGHTDWNGSTVSTRVLVEYVGPGNEYFADLAAPVNVTIRTTGGESIYPRGIQVNVLGEEMVVS